MDHGPSPRQSVADHCLSRKVSFRNAAVTRNACHISVFFSSPAQSTASFIDHCRPEKCQPAPAIFRSIGHKTATIMRVPQGATLTRCSRQQSRRNIFDADLHRNVRRIRYIVALHVALLSVDVNESPGSHRLQLTLFQPTVPAASQMIFIQGCSIN